MIIRTVLIRTTHQTEVEGALLYAKSLVGQVPGLDQISAGKNESSRGAGYDYYLELSFSDEHSIGAWAINELHAPIRNALSQFSETVILDRGLTTASVSSPTIDIIKLACGPKSEEVDECIRNQCALPINWNEVFLSGMWNKVLFILLERLRETGSIDVALQSGNLPLLLLNHWKQLGAVNVHRNKKHIAELKDIATALDDVGLEYCVAKGGPALFGRIYSMEERKTYDIDFLFRRKDLSLIKDVFFQQGYVQGHYNHETGEFHPLEPGELRKWLLHSRGLPNFVKPTGDPFMPHIVVQVQFRVGSTISKNIIESDVIIDKRVQRDDVQYVNDDDLFVQTLLHLYRETTEPSFEEWHMSWNLIKFTDILRLSQYLYNIGSLEGAIVRVKELDLVEPCLYALQLTQLIYPSDAIKHCIEALGGGCERLDEKPTVTEAYVTQHIFTTGFIRNAPKSDWSRLIPSKTH